IDGWLAIESYSFPRENIKTYNTYLILNKKYLSITINHLKMMPKKIIIKLEGYDHISDSEKVLGEKIYIKKSDLKSLKDGDYYWHDLEGLDIYTTREHHLGKVDFIFNNGSNDVMAIKCDNDYIYIAFIKKNIVVIPNEKIIINHETI
ncbi:MAG: ribosome maturation factor RimM, partial [Gammaproteobacteria bacterium]